MTTLLLIRHGQSLANLEKRFAGQMDVKLTETGLAQAKLTAEFIKENYNVSKVYASDLSRAFETGKCVSDLLDIEIIPDKGLREICAGVWEGMTIEDIRKTYPEDFAVWCNDCGNSRSTGGESTAELAERFMTALTEIAQENDGKTVAIATHATALRAAQCLILTGSLAELSNIRSVGNSSVTELYYNNGKWEFGEISIEDHITKNLTTFHASV